MTSLPDDAGDVLVPLARDTITARLLSTDPAMGARVAWLDEPGAAFVTLTSGGALRGCIGTLAAHRPLREDVRSNALAAAFRDPRFQPVAADELDDFRVEVSVLSAPQPLGHLSRAEAEATLRPHVDGVILESESSRGTFLPQVWEQLPRPQDFLDHLVRKARLPDGHWGPDVRLSTYTVTAWHETTPHGPVEKVPAHGEERP